MIVKVIGQVGSIIKMGYFICIALLQYYSLKKLFWNKEKGKIKLFLFSFFTSPFLVIIEVEFIVNTIIGCIWKNRTGTFSVSDNFISNNADVLVTCCVLTGVLYIFMNLLFAWICGEWLNIANKHQVIFLYMMFSTFALCGFRGVGGIEKLFNIPGLEHVVDMLGTIALLVSAYLFYRFDVLQLSQTSYKNIKVNWRLFSIPPACYSFLYAFLFVLFVYDDFFKIDKTLMLTYVFSSTISYLLVWSYYVIGQNIKREEQMKILSVEVMEALAHTIDAKDEYTKGHSVRVANYSRMLAEKMGMSEKECEDVYYMALLHDLGKIGVPNEIINSTTKLTDEEYAVIKTHPLLGSDILSEIKSRPDLVIGARWHHEKYDGKGYPDEKIAEEIPVMARIIAVADSYDAMTSNRSYRKYLPQEKVREEFINNKGTQFDPEIAEVMIAIMDEDKDYILHE